MDAVFYFDGEWLTEAPKLTGPMNQSFWLSAVVFDGARAFGGCAPDLDLHCQRLNNSARAMLLKPTLSAAEVTELCVEAVRKFPKQAELYIRPMYYAEDGFLTPDPESTTFVLAVYLSPIPRGGLEIREDKEFEVFRRIAFPATSDERRTGLSEKGARGVTIQFQGKQDTS